MVSKITTSINHKLAEMNYRAQLMQTFETMMQTPEDKRPRSAKFPSQVEKIQYGIEGRQVLRLRLPNAKKGELLMIHGGAFVMPASGAFNQVVLSFLKLGYTVTVPDYPLAPAGISEIRDWMIRVYRDWSKKSAQPHYIFGDSAGANIAFRLLLDIKTQRYPQPDAVELMSLCPDVTFSVKEEIAQKDLILNPEKMRNLQSGVDYLQFDFMDDINFDNLGRLRFDSGENECEVNDVRTIVERCRMSKGNQVVLELHPELVHDFIMWQAMPESKGAVRSIDNFFQK